MALSPDSSRWIAGRPGFSLPVRVMSRWFHHLFLEYLERAFDAGKLQFFSSLEAPRDRRTYPRHPASARKSECVVSSKPPFAGPDKVFEYVCAKSLCISPTSSFVGAESFIDAGLRIFSVTIFRMPGSRF
jgi:hypothetical protein